MYSAEIIGKKNEIVSATGGTGGLSTKRDRKRKGLQILSTRW